MITLTSPATAATSVGGGAAWTEEAIHILQGAEPAVPRRRTGQEELFPSRLYYGDNLHILRNKKYIPDESVDLVYLDPPFKPTESYNVLFRSRDGLLPSMAQVRAFEDTWRWDSAAAEALHDTMENAPEHVARALKALRALLGESDMFAYMCMMAPRLVELHNVLKPSGSIYLHCDPAASHYLKVLMDAVFGPTHFRNEIVWCYTGPASPRQRQFSRKHDTILFYSKSDKWLFNADAVRVPYSGKTRQNYKEGLVGSGFVAGDETAVRVIHSRGKIPEDYWNIAIAPRGKEYLGYPTQKPKALLQRIIRASSNKGDIVLDPFCGCGTAIEVAEREDRSWIGIDVTEAAIRIVRKRLADELGSSVQSKYSVWGEPASLEDAGTLAATDAYQFQWWAVRRLGAREVERRKGADKGVDGRLILQASIPGYDGFPEAIIQVKAGKAGPEYVRGLIGTLNNEDAPIGVLVTLHEPTAAMRSAAASAGFCAGPGQIPRIQLMTAKDILERKQVEVPRESATAQVRAKRRVRVR